MELTWKEAYDLACKLLGDAQIKIISLSMENERLEQRVATLEQIVTPPQEVRSDGD